MVVGEIDELPLDLFPNVFLLLEFEDMGIELAARLAAASWRGTLTDLLLELFIGVIDTKLLEGILFEVLEAVDIQHLRNVSIGIYKEGVSSSYADEHFRPVRSLSTLTRKAIVDNGNKPFEQACVQELGD